MSSHTRPQPPHVVARSRVAPGASGERIEGHPVVELRAQGHELIVVTARHMATCEGNVGQVIKRIGKVETK